MCITCVFNILPNISQQLLRILTTFCISFGERFYKGPRVGLQTRDQSQSQSEDLSTGGSVLYR